MNASLRQIFLAIGLLTFIACGSGDGSGDQGSSDTRNQPGRRNSPPPKKAKAVEEEEEVLPSQRVDLTTKGVGPIKSMDLPEEIDQALVDKGIEVYKAKCTACHKPDKMLVGPAPAGILERRTPEWIMNMILNPEVMVKEDQLAKDLFLQFNGSPMSNQNLTEDEARAILEYFRTL